MLDRVFDLYTDLERHQVMLSFKGYLSPELVTALLGLVERKMEALETDARLRKRVFSVTMECLQNLYHHNARIAVEDGATVQSEEPQGVVMIARNEKGWSVLTGNFMAGTSVQELQQRLDQVKGMDPDALRALYKSTLNDGRYSILGGGGLGIIDIARRSGGDMEYGFVPYDADNAFFSLNVNVTAQGN